MDILYYFMICILIRLSLAYGVALVYRLPIRFIFMVLYLLLSIGALYQYRVKTRKIGAFNNKVWWDNLRPIHALLFLCTSIGLFYKYKYSYMFLLLDTLIGIVGYIFIKPYKI